HGMVKAVLIGIAVVHDLPRFGSRGEVVHHCVGVVEEPRDLLVGRLALMNSGGDGSGEVEDAVLVTVEALAGVLGVEDGVSGLHVAALPAHDATPSARPFAAACRSRSATNGA